MKKILLAMLISPFLFVSCKKSDPPAPDFTISGITDIKMDYLYGDLLNLTVSPTIDTLLADVTLSVVGLPSGIKGELSRTSGKPTFSSILHFQADNYNTPPGTYPIKIVGTSTFTTKSYDMNLIVPVLNSCQVDGKTDLVDTIEFINNCFLITFANEPGSYLSLYFYNGNNNPASGTYKIVRDPTGSGPLNPDEVGFDFRSDGGYAVYQPFIANNPSMTVTVSGNKTTFTCTGVTVTNIGNSSDTKTISCSVYN